MTFPWGGRGFFDDSPGGAGGYGFTDLLINWKEWPPVKKQFCSCSSYLPTVLHFPNHFGTCTTPTAKPPPRTDVLSKIGRPCRSFGGGGLNVDPWGTLLSVGLLILIRFFLFFLFFLSLNLNWYHLFSLVWTFNVPIFYLKFCITIIVFRSNVLFLFFLILFLIPFNKRRDEVQTIDESYFYVYVLTLQIVVCYYLVFGRGFIIFYDFCA